MKVADLQILVKNRGFGQFLKKCRTHPTTLRLHFWSLSSHFSSFYPSPLSFHRSSSELFKKRKVEPKSWWKWWDCRLGWIGSFTFWMPLAQSLSAWSLLWSWSKCLGKALRMDRCWNIRILWSFLSSFCFMPHPWSCYFLPFQRFSITVSEIHVSLKLQFLSAIFV